MNEISQMNERIWVKKHQDITSSHLYDENQYQIYILFLYNQYLLFFFQFPLHPTYEDNLDEVLLNVLEFLNWNFLEQLSDPMHTNIHFL